MSVCSFTAQWVFFSSKSKKKEKKSRISFVHTRDLQLDFFCNDHVLYGFLKNGFSCQHLVFTMCIRAATSCFSITAFVRYIYSTENCINIFTMYAYIMRCCNFCQRRLLYSKAISLSLPPDCRSLCSSLSFLIFLSKALTRKAKMKSTNQIVHTDW